MAHKLKSLVKIVTDKRNTFLNNGTFTSMYEKVGKQINDKVKVLQDMNNAQLQENKPLPKKIVQWWQWYQKLTGLDAIEMSKQAVSHAQEKLFKCQNQRRELNQLATSASFKLKEIYSDLILTKRDDPKYLQLTMVEHKALQEQVKLSQQISLLEEEEKETFTLLVTAIKEYHDSQTLNAQKYKYLSILASSSVAIVSLVASMIYNNKRIADVRNVMSNAQEKNEHFFNETLYMIGAVTHHISEINENIQINNRNRKEEVPTIVTKSEEFPTIATESVQEWIGDKLGSRYVKIGVGIFVTAFLAMLIR